MTFTYCPAPETLPPFELTETQFNCLMGERPADRELLLQIMVDRHAYTHRKVIGLWGSVAPHGLLAYAEEFNAHLPEFMALGDAAMNKAASVYIRKVA